MDEELCDVCGGKTTRIKCKIKCMRCGYERD